jgi:hypothetical protein
MASVVMVVSGASVWTMKNAKPHPTGFWSEEFVTPHRKFTEAGLKVTVASPGGGSPTVDPLSFNLSYNQNDANYVSEQQDYMKRLGSALTSPMRVEDIDPDRLDAIFLAGGLLDGLPRRRNVGVQGPPAYGLQQRGRDPGGFRRQCAVAVGGSAAYFRRALYCKSTLDAARRRRRQSRHRPTELLGRSNRGRGHEATRRYRAIPTVISLD